MPDHDHQNFAGGSQPTREEDWWGPADPSPTAVGEIERENQKLIGFPLSTSEQAPTSEQGPVSEQGPAFRQAPENWSAPLRPSPGRSSKRAAASHRGPSPVIQAVITMLMLATTLAAARFLVPTIIEESRYAWRRGQLRAEYEGSDGALHNIGLEAISSAYQMVTQRVGPSVVHIEVLRGQPDSPAALKAIGHSGVLPPGMSDRDQGSGVIVDANGVEGLVLTNHHVVAEGHSITVGLSDGRRVAGSVIGSDPLSDVALLRIRAGNLLPVEWGDSDTAEVGMPVWAVGSPFGLDHTVTFGILSGKHRAAKAMGNHRYQDFMQSDVAVNPGSSGGPLVDARGRLIGINTMIVGDTYRGVSFSIPSNVARRVFERLRESGRFDRGWLGVELADVPDEMVEGENYRVRGALVQRLTAADSPAARAGISSGDIILQFDGQRVADVGALMRMIGNWPAGEMVDIELLREGQRHTVSVVIGERPETAFLR